jgi:hypothetical protein
LLQNPDIVEQADVAEAAARLDAKQKSKASPECQFGQSLGRTPQNGTEKGAPVGPQMIPTVLPN